MGGNIAVTYAGLRPGRVGRVVTLEGLGLARTSADDAPGGWPSGSTRCAIRPVQVVPSYDQVAQRLKRNNPRLTEEKAEFLARHWAEPRTRAASAPLRPAPQGPESVSLPHRGTLACWRRVTAPVLLVSGRESHIRGG